MNRRSEHRSTAHSTRLRDRLREATNEAILQAAEEVFAQQGLHAAKMEAIASRAGVSVGTLYNHFHDRQDLVAQLLDARHADMLRSIDAVLAGSARRPFREQLRDMLVVLCQKIDEQQTFLAILLQGETTRDRRSAEVVISKPRKVMRQFYDRMAVLVSRGLKSRALRADPSDIYPTMLMGMVRSLMMRRLFHEDVRREPPLTERVDQIVEFFMHGAGA